MGQVVHAPRVLPIAVWVRVPATASASRPPVTPGV